ncbi:MAG: cytidylate kinase-like family protein [Tessaracoccus sp.]|uniref:cytidylate kinase-like family protein n=1 Tax=Tessaracoccus sp. TaxID=1971211 RepID=UPI001EC8EA06|nr:cytidylate kinase-like family protein [Tessaracoccus sp.]MBK7822303.1 cytidylate kinase-like family protein [Tessaracoccus sp.]
MSVITISRQLGSHGGRIARGVAKELGWKLADKSTINGVIKQYGLIHLDDIYGDEPPSFWDLYKEDSVWTIEWMNKTIEAIGAGGDVVILGRGGFVVLGGYADSLDVFVKAPVDVRANRIAQRDGISDEKAADKIKADDKTRQRFTKRIYGTGWADEKNFDLVVDTGAMSDEEAIAAIVAAYTERQADLADGKLVSSIEVDPALKDSIDKVFS